MMVIILIVAVVLVVTGLLVLVFTNRNRKATINQTGANRPVDASNPRQSVRTTSVDE